ncbi:sterol desaturase family protein [Aspergillus saccharolyticus JOP 1030-1]|uniref:Fatty acid hydroxylase superfamily protein n=1 Tax=Aspergillus saccharolyticus JOP 1030-1 TaxID=1450539 RepID=A0A318Z333_9EURO|nr:fatty acid hydroxylase superfamily protein [Aspergillus saccharolyticus JOP 1030-1]PYH40697.1 fatty acid hydroxylase superfamily protein [Aspergillus saccharolyticus JOP 1030-1]
MSGTHPKPQDSMKSTWRQIERKQWRYPHWMIELLGIHHINLDQEVPVHAKDAKMPYLPEYSLHRWILWHALLPLLVHQLYVTYTGHAMSRVGAFVFYSVAFKLIAVHQLHVLRRLGHVVGFFDGDQHPRDGVPDVGIGKVVQSLLSTSTFRPVMTVFLAYQPSQAPSHMSWTWLMLEIGLYGIVLDFWFYWYHRLMHDVEGLWKYHRTHHLTKHPNPLLSLYADTEQEIFDIAGIPLLAYWSLKLMGCPMGFYEWWICHQYVMFSELTGHSGLRVWSTAPSTLSWLLRLTGTELVLEDHDLHHRKGWKQSANYGKQTRLWDRLFGTCRERIECRPENVDWDRPVPMPIF